MISSKAIVGGSIIYACGYIGHRKDTVRESSDRCHSRLANGFTWQGSFLVKSEPPSCLQELPAGLKHLQSRSPGLSKLLPLNSAFELLCAPMTCYGLGIHIKQVLIVCPSQTVNAWPCYHLLKFDTLQRMTLADAHFGKFEEEVFSEHV